MSFHVASQWHHDSAVLLWFLLPTLKLRIKSSRRLELRRKFRSLESIGISGILELGSSTDSRNEYSKEEQLIPNRLNIIVWISICILNSKYNSSQVTSKNQVLLTKMKSQKLSRKSKTEALIPRIPYHASLPKICWSRNATRVGDATQEKYPTYTH